MDPLSGGALALGLLKRFWLPALLVSLLVVQTVRLEGFWFIDGVRDNLEDCETNRKELRAERDGLIEAQKEAKRLNEQQVQRIEKEQQEITDDIEARYKADRDRLQRELAERLRKPSAPGDTRGTAPSPDGKAPSGPDEKDGLPLSSQDFLRAAEIELQLMHLQNWVEQQLQVER